MAKLSRVVLCGALAISVQAEPGKDLSSRRVERFDFDWKFLKADAPGAERPDFNDAPWSRIDLPHDWSIEGPFDEKNPGKSSFGYLPGGVGWYRKDFQVPSEDRGKKVALQFDGIYENSKVWLNGVLLGERGYGYIGFEYDLTPHLKLGGNNVLAVRAENLQQPNCRWYSGSGIYRHTWLTITDPLHVAHWGTSITTPGVDPAQALVRVRTRIQNDGRSPRSFSFETSLSDARGNEVGAGSSPVNLAPGASLEIAQEIVVRNPLLWSPQAPVLYSAKSRLVVAGNEVDEVTTPFGIRTILFDKDRGFVLNGTTVKMKGVNLHQDGGAVGAAIPIGVWERRLKTLKEIGCNAIRCSHNPPSPEFLDLCDRMGFLVIDEAFDKWQYEFGRHFAKDWRQDLEAMLERDRNHPCVVLWSVGNENGGAWPEKNFATYRKLADVVHQLEPTRPVTAALRPFDPPKENPTKQGLLDLLLPMVNALDVACLNYQEHLYEDLRKANPNLVLIGSESLMYYRGEGTKYKSTNDNNPWFDVEKNSYVAGQFLWTGIDYLGESEGWPAKGKSNSLIDTTGFRKDRSYWHQSVWSEKPMVHIAVFDELTEDYPGKKFWDWPKIRSHWSFPGREQQLFTVSTFSNCESVELFLNGKSLGIKRPADFKNRSALWKVTYEPGELKAFGMSRGQPVASWVLKTSGPDARIALVPDKTEMRGDAEDVIHLEARIEDTAGTLVPDAALPLSFVVEGAAKLIGVDSGDLRSNESFKGTLRITYRGRALAILQSGRRGGPIQVVVSAPGLPKAAISLKVRSFGQ